MRAVNLPDGLVLRGVNQDDVEPLAAFEARTMHFPMGFHIQEWLRGDHPTARTDFFTVVEKEATGEIVSAAGLLPQTFQYDGITFPAGRMEAVATDPEYRRRGLVRQQFAALHAQADQEGFVLQVVEGAVSLYQKFGYALALENTGGMNSGGLLCHRPLLPSLGESATETFQIREAGPADLAFVASVYEQTRTRYRLTSQEPLSHWEFLLRGGTPDYNRWYRLQIVEEGGEPVAFFIHDLWGAGCLLMFEVTPGRSWLAVAPAVLRFLFAECDREAGTAGATQTVRCGFGSHHPIYDAAPRYLSPFGAPLAVWGVRINDLPDFLKRIAPALQARLPHSVCAGHTGTFAVNFGASGAALRFDDGRLTQVHRWKPTDNNQGDASFSHDAFVPLLLSYRNLQDTRQLHPECRVETNAAEVLLNALFPLAPSHLGPLA